MTEAEEPSLRRLRWDGGEADTTLAHLDQGAGPPVWSRPASPDTADGVGDGPGRPADDLTDVIERRLSALLDRRLAADGGIGDLVARFDLLLANLPRTVDPETFEDAVSELRRSLASANGTPPPEITGLTERLDAIERGLANLTQPTPDPQLTQRLDAIEQRLANLTQPTPDPHLTQRLDAIEQRLGTLSERLPAAVIRAVAAASADEERSALTDRLAEVSSATTEIVAELRSLSRSGGPATEKIDTVARAVADMVLRLDAITDATAERVQSRVEGTLGGVLAAVTELGHRMGALEPGGRLEALESLVGSAGSNIERLAADVDGLTAEVVGLRDTVAPAVGRLEATVTDLGSRMASIDDLAGSIGNLPTRVAGDVTRLLREDLEALAERSRCTETSLAALSGHLEQLRDALSALGGEMGERFDGIAADTRSRHGELIGTVGAVRDALVAAATEAEAADRALVEAVEAATGRIEELGASLANSLSRAQDDARARLEGLADRVLSAVEAVGDHARTVIERTERLDGAIASLADLTDPDGAGGVFGALHARLDDQRERVDALVELLRRQDRSLPEVGEQVGAVADRIAETHGLVGATAEGLRELIRTVGDLRAPLDEQSAGIADGLRALNERVDRLEGRVGEVLDRLSGTDLPSIIRRTIGELLAETEDPVDQIEARLSDLRDRIESVPDATSRLLGGLSDRIRELETTVEAALSGQAPPGAGDATPVIDQLADAASRLERLAGELVDHMTDAADSGRHLSVLADRVAAVESLLEEMAETSERLVRRLGRRQLRAPGSGDGTSPG